MANILRALRTLFPAPTFPIGFFTTREQAVAYARRELGRLGRRMMVVNHQGGYTVYCVGGR